MNWRRTTQLFIGMLIILVIIYDISAAIFGGRHETISGIFWDMPVQLKCISSFLMGGLFVHLFIQQDV